MVEQSRSPPELENNSSPEHSNYDKKIVLTDIPGGLPMGKYTLVGCDMDTTGRRLLDEIFHIAGYTPKSQFSQYIMPHGDLNIFAKRKYSIRVVTIGRYRMLRDNHTYKILKTKSEISALTDFLNWLEMQKGDSSSIILINHEQRRFSIIMLLEALKRYNLLDRFMSLVVGITDAYAVTVVKCQHIVKSLSLRVLGRVLLDKEPISIVGALDRATITYEIVEHLAQDDRNDLEDKAGGAGDNNTAINFLEMACRFGRPISSELEALNNLKEYLIRQNAFKPVFLSLLRIPFQRKRATNLRRIIVESGISFDQIKDIWEREKEEGLKNLIEPIAQTKADEIIEILVSYFDHANRPKEYNRRSKNQGNSSSEAGNNDGSSATTSTQGSPLKSSSDGGLSDGVDSLAAQIDSIQMED